MHPWQWAPSGREQSEQISPSAELHLSARFKLRYCIPLSKWETFAAAASLPVWISLECLSLSPYKNLLALISISRIAGYWSRHCLPVSHRKQKIDKHCSCCFKQVNFDIVFFCAFLYLNTNINRFQVKWKWLEVWLQVRKVERVLSVPVTLNANDLWLGRRNAVVRERLATEETMLKTNKIRSNQKNTKKNSNAAKQLFTGSLRSICDRLLAPGSTR